MDAVLNIDSNKTRIVYLTDDTRCADWMKAVSRQRFVSRILLLHEDGDFIPLDGGLAGQFSVNSAAQPDPCSRQRDHIV